MPFFGWTCPQCEKSDLRYRARWEPGMHETCKECDVLMERDLHVETRRHTPASAFPYVTKNIAPDGSPIEVKSLDHLRSLERQYGVRNRDDADYVEEQWRGWDVSRKEHVYGGGRGGGSSRWV